MKNEIVISPGNHFRINEEMFIVIKFDSLESIEAKSFSTGLKSTISLSAITESYAQINEGPKVDLDAIDKDEWDRVLQIYNHFKHLINDSERKETDVIKVAEQLFISKATAYRYLEKLERTGTITCLLRKPRVDKGVHRISPNVEAIIKKVLIDEYLQEKRISPTEAHNEIKRLCRNKKLDPPSLDTVKKRIAALNSIERAEKRDGRNAALDLTPQKGSLPDPHHLNGMWQIDHTPVDIILVDEKDRIAIGRPWITIIIDIFSRMVMGWYISFDTPGSLGTGIAISRAILAKNELLAKLGISLPWPSQGKPSILMCDNAKEFRGNMLRNACGEHKIDLRFRPVKKPNYGAHIERLQGTLLQRIHRLDGTTFSNVEQKGEYDSAKHANMTLVEFERWLANLILGQYHNEIHSAIGCSPLQKFKEGLFGTDTSPGLGKLKLAADPQKLQFDFLPYEERTIQPSGITLDHIEYHDPVLDRWIGSLAPGSTKVKRKFIFRRDPRDISVIFFWDPDVKQYYRIPYRNSRHSAISLWELHAIQKSIRNKGKAELNEDAIFEAFNEMRAIEDSSRELTKKARANQEKRLHHARNAHSRPTPKASVIDISSSKDNSLGLKIDLTDLMPFDEIESMK